MWFLRELRAMLTPCPPQEPAAADAWHAGRAMTVVVAAVVLGAGAVVTALGNPSASTALARLVTR